MRQTRLMLAVLLAVVIALGMAPGITGASGTVLEVGVGRTYATIQAAIGAASDGDTIRVMDAAHTEPGQINIPGSMNLTIEGGVPGVTISRVTGGTSYFVAASGAGTLTLRNLTINALGSTTTNFVVHLSGLTSVTVENVTVIGQGRNYLTSGTTYFYSGPGATNVVGGLDLNSVGTATLSNVTVRDVGRNGISFTDVPNITLSNFATQDTGHSATASTGWAGLALYGNSGLTSVSGGTITNAPIGVNAAQVSAANPLPGTGAITISGVAIPVAALNNVNSDAFAQNVTGTSFKVWAPVAPAAAGYFHTGATAMAAAAQGNVALGVQHVSYDLVGARFIVGPGMLIQTAITAASPGDTISVFPGTYVELVTVDKALTLRSDTLHGAEIRGTVVIDANDVVVDGFSITNFRQVPIPDWSGIYIPSGTGVQVRNNLIDGIGRDPVANLTVGVHTLSGGTAGVLVQGNTIRNVRMGVYNQGAAMTITGNTIENTAHCAIGVDTTLATTVSGNVITNSGLHFNGVVIEDFRNALDIQAVLTANTFDRAVVVRGTGTGITVPTIFSRIQAAIAVAPVGATVSAAAGTYDEQVVIDKNLTLEGAGVGTIVRPSSAAKLAVVRDGLLWFPGARQIAGIIVADIPGGTVTVRNLTVDQRGVAAMPVGAECLAGVFFRETGGAIRQVSIVGTGLWTPGRAVGVYLSAANPAVVEVSGSTIVDYDRSGIEAFGGGLTANIRNNTITGRGPTVLGDECQNGIVIGRGATVTVHQNSISNMSYSPLTWWSAGVLAGTGASVAVTENAIADVQIGIIFDNAGGSAELNTVNGGAVGLVGLWAQYYEPGTWAATFRNNTVTVANDTAAFENAAIGCATWHAGASVAFVAEGNTLTGNTGTDADGIWIGDVPSSNPAGTITATIAGNTVSGWQHGIRLASSVGANSAITDNTITDNVDSGVRIESAVNALNVRVNGNRISGNDVSGVLNSGTGTLDAERNWWGHASGPSSVGFGLGDAVSTNVDYRPWFSDFALTTEADRVTPTITVPPAASAITYGQALSASTLTGGQAMVGTTTVAGSFSFTTPTATPAVGTPPVSVTFTPTDSANYGPVTGSVAVTVNRRAASVIPDGANKIFGQPDPALTGVLIGFLPADGVSAVYSRAPGEAVGTYNISAALAAAPGVLDNYLITFHTAVFTIEPEPVAPPPPPPPPPPPLPFVAEDVAPEAGGSVALADDVVVVEIPVGATETPVTFGVGQLPADDVPEVPGVFTVLGRAIKVTAEDVAGEPVREFAVPLTITFKFTPEEVAGQWEDLVIMYYDELLGWIAMDTTVDPETGLVSTTSYHLTVFTVVRWAAPVVEHGAQRVVMLIDDARYAADHKLRHLDVEPFIQNGRTFVPVRFLAEAFGAEADWTPKDAAPDIVTLTRADRTITITIGEEPILVNQQGVITTVDSDVAAFIQDGRTMLPFRVIAEAFGATVDYGPKDAPVKWVSFEQ